MRDEIQFNKKDSIKNAIFFIAGVITTVVVYPTVSKHTEEIENLKRQYEVQLVEQSASAQQELMLMTDEYEAEIDKIKKESATKQEQMSSKINSLIQENSSLKRKTKTTTIEKVSPDGTVERRTVSEETLETITQRVAEVEQQAEKKLRETVDKVQQEHEKLLSEVNTKHESTVKEYSSKIANLQESLSNERSKSETLKVNDKKLGIGVGYNSDLLYKVHGHYSFWGATFLGLDIDTNGSNKNRAALSIGLSI